ncbi:hypothetical protein ABT160_46710 [Streptomyces sp. NPDC001941]|uniref:hypothetical protein n=1 Tax=Streptomyces sp. NPDC001941 TaxID=3154659 RepID=UPI0033226ACB
MTDHLSTPRIYHSARTWRDYQEMFLIDAGALKGLRVLDCPAGGSDFTARAAECGAGAVAVDPLYSLELDTIPAALAQDQEHLNAHATADTSRGYRRLPDRGVFDHWSMARARFEAGVEQQSHQGAGPYVAAQLPELPFQDKAFDLTLSGFLLFVYAGLLDEDFHVRAVRELLRVTRGEVRIHPVETDGAEPTALLTTLASAFPSTVFELRAASVSNRVKPRSTLILRPREGC